VNPDGFCSDAWGPVKMEYNRVSRFGQSNRSFSKKLNDELSSLENSRSPYNLSHVMPLRTCHLSDCDVVASQNSN